MHLATERPSLTLLTRVPPALATAWRSGTVLEAQVVSTDEGKGTARVHIQGRTLDVRTELPLQPGQRLLLKAETQPGQWRLHLQSSPEQMMLDQTLRQVLPRQQPLAPAVQAFVRAATDPQLPPPVRMLATQLAALVPEPQRLATAEGLQQAIERSGLFLEARLATPASTQPPTTSQPQSAPQSSTGTLPAPAEASVALDFKGLLLRLLHLLRGPASSRADKAEADTDSAVAEALRTLARYAESALARIELRQVRALPESGERTPELVLELPFRQGEQLETLTLRIRREQEHNGGSEGQTPWTVTLELGDGKSGALRAVVTWSNHTVSTRFFAARSELTGRINASLNLLDTRLRAAGLEVGTLEAHTGPASSEEPLPQGLLRERA